MSDRIISTEPATGAELWSGEPGDAAAEVAAARAALPEWAAHSTAYRFEALRRDTLARLRFGFAHARKFVFQIQRLVILPRRVEKFA